MAITKDMEEKKILLVTTGSGSYRADTKKVLEAAFRLFGGVCCITINDPCKALEKGLDMKKGSSIHWIDAVSSTVGEPAKADNATFVSSPRALTDISIAVKNVVDAKKAEFFVFDSLSAMLVYEQPTSILKFIHSLALTFRSAGVGAAFIILKPDAKGELMKDLNMFVDKVVEGE